MSKSERQRRANELRELIAKAGLSQAGAAAELERTDRMMSYWLTGEHDVPMLVLHAMRWIAQQRASS